MSTYVKGITYTGSGTLYVGKTETVGGAGIRAPNGSVRNFGTVAVTTSGGSLTGGVPGIYAGQSVANYGSATGGGVGNGGGAGGPGIQLRRQGWRRRRSSLAALARPAPPAGPDRVGGSDPRRGRGLRAALTFRFIYSTAATTIQFASIDRISGPT